MSSNQRPQLACLYTKHKTQKRKIWQDGRLVLSTKSCKAILHDANPPLGSGDPSLGECEIATSQLQAILREYYNKNDGSDGGVISTTIETEKYLIEIEGPWTNGSSSASPVLPSQRRLPSRKKTVSSSMKKLFASKFQKPKAYIPPPPANQTSRAQQILGKRRRPLQPGELVSRHYGRVNNSVNASSNSFHDRRISHSYQLQGDQRQDSHRIGEPQGSKPPPFRSELQRYGQQPPPRQQQEQRPREPPIETSSQLSTESHFQNHSTGVGGYPFLSSADMRSQSRIAQEQHHRHPNPRRKQNTNSFVQNEFDSANYYGVDGEEKDDDEGEGKQFNPSLQAPLVDANPPSSYAPTLVDERKGEQRRIDDQNIRSINHESNPEEGTINEKDLRKHPKSTRRYDEHNEKNESSSSSPTTWNRQIRNRNKTEFDEDDNNRNESIMEEQTSKQYKNTTSLSSRGLIVENTEHNEGEESESDEDELSNDGNGEPSSFRLKPMKSFAGVTENTGAAKSSSNSGSRLLALFGAGGGTSKNENRINRIGDRINDSYNNKNIEDGKRNFTAESQTIREERISKNNKENGFYLAPATTSSEESSDEDDTN